MIQQRVRQTSVEAYREIVNNGVLSKQMELAYKIMFNKGSLTGQELHREMLKEMQISGGGNCVAL